MTAPQISRNVAADDGFEAWHHATCRNYSLSECRRDAQDPFAAELTTRPLGPLALSDGSSNSPGTVHLHRGSAHIRKDPCDHFMLFLVVKGTVGLAQDDRQVLGRAKDLFLYDQTRPFSLDFERQYRTVMLTIPRPLLESRIPHASRLTAHRIPGESKFGALAGSVLRQLAELDGMLSAPVERPLAASAIETVSAALAAEFAADASSEAEEHRLLATIQEFLLANLADTALSTDTIAAAQNVAPRTLNRVFATAGTTPMRWLWRQRLNGSYSALAEGRARSVTDAAVDFGFSDISHFSRTFKARFGMPPRALLAN
jgi:AraC-like DNA-binding protein